MICGCACGVMVTPKTTSVLFFLLTLCVPLLVSADVIINEFLYDAPGTDTDQEYVELLNTGSAPVDLTKWKINDGSSHTFNVPPKNGGTGSSTIAPGGYVLLVDNAANFISAHSGVSGTVIDTVLSLANLSGTISLLDDSGTIVSTVSYTKDQGGNGDGNSLQKNGSSWIMALPTLNAANATTAAVPVVADSATSTSTSTTSTQTVTTAPVSSYVAPPVPTLFADAGDDRAVIVGADTEFDGRAYNRDREEVDHVRFMWNFGDGSTAEGSSVMHHYEYPGLYAAVLSIAQNRTAVIDKIIVEADPARLSFTTIPDGSVAIGNQDSRELDLSGWIVRAFGRTFILPEHSILLKGSSLHISQKTLDFFSGPETELDYPNGVLALKANASTPGAPTVTAAPAPSIVAPAAISAEDPELADAAVASTSKDTPEPVASAEEVVETPIASATSSLAETAAAASATGGAWYWWLGPIAIVAVVGGVLVWVRRMKAGEWDIVEETPEAE
jgi:hypothetical protein